MKERIADRLKTLVQTEIQPYTQPQSIKRLDEMLARYKRARLNRGDIFLPDFVAASGNVCVVYCEYHQVDTIVQISALWMLIKLHADALGMLDMGLEGTKFNDTYRWTNNTPSKRRGVLMPCLEAVATNLRKKVKDGEDLQALGRAGILPRLPEGKMPDTSDTTPLWSSIEPKPMILGYNSEEHRRFRLNSHWHGR
jgi:hypothetical protein